MDQDNQYALWYSAASRQQEPPSPPRPVRKKRTGVKVTAIILSVLVLLVATALVFSDDAVSPSESVQRPSGFGGSPSVPDSGDEDDGGFDDDFRDFFSDYFVPDETERVPSEIRRGKTGTGLTLELVSSASREELSLQELYEKCAPSIVGIRAGDGRSASYTWGSGIVMTADGYILTNQHIVAGNSVAYVVLPDGGELEASLIGEDPETDIAVLKVTTKRRLVPAEFGDSSELAVGDKVAAIGNPLGSEFSGTMTDGIISAINRSVNASGRTMTLIQTNAAINEGNSGGALINAYGQVIGVTNLKMVNNYSEVSIEGIGFAIPTSTVKTVADQLLAKGEVTGRPGIGITVGSIPAEAAEYYDLPDGLYITAVSRGSDAEAKGVQVGDVLTHVNGQPVRYSDEVLAIRDTLGVGDTITLTLYRDGKTFDLEIQLQEIGDIY